MAVQAKLKIMLDAGHGEGKGSNRGSLIGNEGDNNFAYSLVLKKELERYQDVKVLLTRPKSSDNPTLKERGALAKGSDLLLSLHSNAYNGKAQGISIFDSVQKPNKVLATALLTSLSKFWKRRQVYYISLSNDKNRDYYGVLRDSGAKSSMMIEHGFHDYLPDVTIYVNKRKEIAQATAQTIAKHYRLTLKPQPQPTPIPDGKAKIKAGAKYVSLSSKYHGKPVGDQYIGVEYDYQRDKVPSQPTWIYLPKLYSYVDEKDLDFGEKGITIKKLLPKTEKVEVITYKEVTKYPVITLNKDTSLWDFNHDSWDKIKSVKEYKKGSIIEVVDIVTNPMGRKYYRTGYSSEKGLYHGFNEVDCELGWK